LVAAITSRAGRPPRARLDHVARRVGHAADEGLHLHARRGLKLLLGFFDLGDAGDVERERAPALRRLGDLEHAWHVTQIGMPLGGVLQ
jgi:hypothetical protein